MTQRWKRRPEGSNWGDFGEDDQLGSLNYITPDMVRQAARTIEHGKAFCLSLPLDYPGGTALAPHRTPPVLEPTTRRGRPYFNFSFREEAPHYCDVGCDDRVTLSTQYSTQWDSFAHIGREFDLMDDGNPRRCFYNGFIAGEHIIPPEERSEGYAMPLGIDAFAARPIQGRGVLLDIERHFGRDMRNLTYADLAHIIETDEVAIEPGDILCLHTGFADEVLKMNRRPDPQHIHSICAALDGRDEALLNWITMTKVAAIASDNFAVERVGLPASGPDAAFVPLHHHCLFKRGIPLGELWHLTELANWLRSNRRSSFFLTAPPLRLPGAVGSPVTPVATV
jgi:kynurenine formamidase